MGWEITHGVTTQSPELWGVRLVRRERSSAARGMLVLGIEADADAAATFTEGDQLTLLHDAARVFEGTVGAPVRAGDPDGEGLQIPVFDGWHWLDGIVFQQSWGTRPDLSDPAAAAVAVNSARVALGQTAAGAPQTTGAEIGGIIDWAISQGAPITKGTILTGFLLPGVVEMESVTCTEALRTLLRWHPDAVAYFDHSTSPPTLHVQARSALSTATVNALTGGVVSFDTRELVRRKAPYVEIQYRKRSQVDGRAHVDLDVIRHPTGAPSDHLGAVVEVVDLTGPNATTQKQEVEVQPIPGRHSTWDGSDWTDTDDPDGAGTRADVRDFLLDHVAWLKEVPALDWEVWLDTWGVRLAPQTTTEGDPVGEAVDDFPNELIKGQIAPWMSDQDDAVPPNKAAVAAAALECRAVIYYKGAAVHTEGVRKHFPQQIESEDGTKKRRSIEVLVNVTGTDAESKVYEGLASFAQGETTPTGVAQKVYNALNATEHEGEVVISAADPASTVAPGQKLTLSGLSGSDFPAGSLVQSETTDFQLQPPETTVRVGAPSHLSPQDLIELLRMTRANPITYVTEDERAEGEQPTKGEAQAGTWLPASRGVQPSTAPDTFPLMPSATATATGYAVFVEPGTLVCETTTGAPPTVILPTMGGANVDSATAKLAGTGAQKLYLERTLSAKWGNCTAAEFKLAATVPADTDTLEHVEWATVDDTGGTVEVDIKCPGYFWPAGINGNIEFQTTDCDDVVSTVKLGEVARGRVVSLLKPNIAIGECNVPCSCCSGCGGGAT